MSKLLKWVLGAFVVFYILSDPSAAAGTVHGLLGDLQNAGNSLAQFVSGLGSK